jgi:transposase
VICVETIGKIRRWHRVDKLSISKIAKRLSASRNTIAKYLDGEVTQPRYKAPEARPGDGSVGGEAGGDAGRGCAAAAEGAAHRPAAAGWTGAGRFHRLVSDGATVRQGLARGAPARGWHTVFIPQSFAPGEAYQFDWSYETVDLGGRPTPVKVAHLRLCHSRVFLAVAYLREAQEMVFDAHWRAFSLWGGSCQRGIYDNLKTAVELIFTGKGRQYNRKFLQMASHYLIEPVACTPAAGWEKGQVENQVGHVRENIFTCVIRIDRFN